MTDGDNDLPLERLIAQRAMQLRRREHARRRARVRARRRVLALLSLLILVSVVILAWSLSSSGGGKGPTSPTSPAAVSQVALPSLKMSFPSSGSPDGAAPRMPLPSGGEGAVAIMGTGVIEESPRERSVPIASLTKMMTAYLVLRSHPLTGDESGPSFRFTTADHMAWLRYAEDDLSNVELVNREVLSERQLLEALLIPSADNVADWFARWVGGTEAHFVSMMNATARSLGMDHTHYADASGVDPKTVSTAADQALLASIDMRNPVFRSIVTLASVPFPVEGRVWNYNPALDVDGIVGVKSGFTQAAGGCLVTAAWRTVGGRRVLVIASVTGQVLGLPQAADQDEDLIEAAAGHLETLTPFGGFATAGTLAVPWLRSTFAANLASPVSIVGWGGLRLSAALSGAVVTPADVSHGWPQGSVVGWLRIQSQFGPVEVVPVRIERAVSPPPHDSVDLRAPESLAVVG